MRRWGCALTDEVESNTSGQIAALTDTLTSSWRGEALDARPYYLLSVPLIWVHVFLLPNFACRHQFMRSRQWPALLLLAARLWRHNAMLVRCLDLRSIRERTSHYTGRSSVTLLALFCAHYSQADRVMWQDFQPGTVLGRDIGLVVIQ